MNEELKNRILENQFVDQIRISMNFDKSSFNQLCEDLRLLSVDLKRENSIDKELMLYLYSAPTIIRNSFLSFPAGTEAEIATHLEDAWLALDELVTECLVD